MTGGKEGEQKKLPLNVKHSGQREEETQKDE
jgi:hypothetical protein